LKEFQAGFVTTGNKIEDLEAETTWRLKHLEKSLIDYNKASIAQIHK